MKKIILVCTTHLENGKCNAQELFTIIDKIKPEIIFLEATDQNYSRQDEMLFKSFGVFHKKLELKAVQMYQLSASIIYVPVLNFGLSDKFDMKYDIVCKNSEFKCLLDGFNQRANEEGFEFLNSAISIKLHNEMNHLADQICADNRLNEDVQNDIDKYENSMIENINNYCQNNDFSIAIFLCGNAHRASLIEKFKNTSQFFEAWGKS